MKKRNFYIYITPLFLILSVFYLIPILDVFKYSFTDIRLGENQYSFTFSSYFSVFSDLNFWIMLKTTLLFVFLSIIIQIFLGILIAALIDEGEKRNLKGTLILRTVVLIAWVIPGVIIGIIWKLFLTEANYGIFNYYLMLIFGHSFPFLSSQKLAIYSIIVANVWRGTAFSMIMQYGGIKQIPYELYEAAGIDGASGIKKFFYITLPQLKPMIFINTVLVTIYTFNTFDMIMALTGGGPGRSTEVISLNIYDTIFGKLNLSRGSVLAVILFFINLIISIFYYKMVISKGGVEND
ncbi:carbohydrate ABC transporter permease [Marinitoga sp. 1155]|uniref:carbohydrate ABC transporter permease n=1 Tax=Marinitoga sp. 1155 TaxID=1428448 RepID=UPI00065900E2|nr:sugar ABC transporter permease [Marinitoga sp. 1155]KLO24633.1 ABC transporter permease [Marinitoga sp. 1155]